MMLKPLEEFEKELEQMSPEERELFAESGVADCIVVDEHGRRFIMAPDPLTSASPAE